MTNDPDLFRSLQEAQRRKAAYARYGAYDVAILTQMVDSKLTDTFDRLHEYQRKVLEGLSVGIERLVLRELVNGSPLKHHFSFGDMT